ncbi:MAG TPA: LON peptidase substrate-binding domain-containing protein [Chthoniobacteraceae bacterium]|jgi:Lon protease-like protein|nr:LON peptidase substrate-binding domain-containing protein [Chthoniobacteraceae bacterium]
MKSGATQQVELPSQVPVMFLPGLVLLPHVLLPLFIFEPRYRAMLAHALAQERMFCMATLAPGVEEVRGPDDYFHTCGVGLVRACVGHEDGTSHLILQGLARVQLRGFVQEQPFKIAEVRELPPSGGGDEQCRALATRLRHLCSELTPDPAERKKLEEQLAQIEEPAMLADVMAHTFLRDSAHRQEVLLALQVEERLRVVIRHLRAENAG